MATLHLVCGLPGSGKTTLACDLEVSRGAFRLGADEWLNALGLSLWDEPMRDRVERLQWQVGCSLLSIGTSVIVEWGCWARDERDRLRIRARELGAGVELYVLDAPDEELWRRIRARGMEDPPIRHEDLAGWRAVFQPPDGAEKALYDRVHE